MSDMAMSWGVGRYRDDAGAWNSVEFSDAEFQREVAAAEARLRSWGVERQDIVLVIAGVAEAGQFGPMQRAARQLGAITVIAEATEFDARRVAAMLERFTLRAVIGLDAAVLRGLAQAGDVKTILGRCGNLIVREDAFEAVAALGLSPAAMHVLGPTLALECPARAGAHLDPRAWALTQAGDRVEIRPAAGRDLQVARAVSERPGVLAQSPCACGSADPRFILRRN